MRRHKRGYQGIQPGWFRKYAGEDISHIEKGGHQENLFYRLVLPLHHDQPHDKRANRNRHKLRKPEQSQASRNARKLSYNVEEVQKKNPQHHKKRDAKPELLADQVAQALARDRSHARRDLLNHD